MEKRASRRRFLRYIAGTTLASGGIAYAPKPRSATTIRTAVALPESSYVFSIIKHWGDLVNARSGGDLDMRIFPGGSLIRGDQSFDALRRNAVQFSEMINPVLSPRTKDVAPLDLVGSFPANRITATHDAIYTAYNEILNKQKLHYMFALDGGRNTIAVRSGGPVKHPDQLKGKLIRDAGGVWTGRMIRAWGGTPQTIPFADLVPALQRGTADGIVIGTPGLSSLKLYEICPFVTIFPNSAQFYYSVAGSLDFLRSLPPNQVKLLLDTGREAMEWGVKLQEQQAAANIERMRKAGATVYVLTEAEEDAFRRNINPLLEQMKSELSPDGQRLLAALRGLS